MRVVLFILSLIITVALVILLDTPLPVAGAKTPRLGYFLSPQHGFWQNAEPLDQNYSSTVELTDLEGKAEVYFDDRLVPHVYAEKERDAYFIQGYLHAKFRLWQMEFQTHAAAGRLSEILGAKSGTKDFLKIDRFFRRLGMVYAAEKSLAALEADPTTKQETDAYTAGVNAYISSMRPSQIPLEYKLLDYKPEKWTNLKSQLFLKFMSYDLTGKDSDFEMTALKKAFSDAEIESLYPVTQDSLDPIIPKGTAFMPPSFVPKSPASADSVYFNAADSTIRPFVLQPDPANGSNNWAVAGSKTKSGVPILCNDPHLGLNLPSLWYEMQISTPEFNTYGASFPGSPSIIIGFNDSIAWGVTNAGRDVKDYYQITFRDSSMQEYLYNGQWVKTSFRNEVIKVKGAATITEKIAMTVFGPVMYDKKFPNPLKDGKYYAVRWKAHDPSNELLTFNKLNKAKNYDEYLKAISAFQTPGQNFAFASKSGDIAIKQQGWFPAKWRRQGDFVMPGIDTVFQWQGIIQVRENPKILNPERGFVSSANQLAADTTYPYYLGGPAEVYRGLSINRRLNTMTGITVEDMQRLQTDNYNVFAAIARPLLLKYLDQSSLQSEQSTYLDVLKQWNLRMDANERGATIFKVFWDTLSAGVYNDELARIKMQIPRPDESTLIDHLIKDSAYKFVDNINTQKVETINDIVTLAWQNAVNELTGIDREGKLEWGKYKESGIQHLLAIPALSRLNLGIGGGENVINATKRFHGPSWRMVVQMSDKIEAYAVYPGGQSGNPGSKYYDTFVDYWASGKYYPILFLQENEAKSNGRVKWKMTFTKAKNVS